MTTTVFAAQAGYEQPIVVAAPEPEQAPADIEIEPPVDTTANLSSELLTIVDEFAARHNDADISIVVEEITDSKFEPINSNSDLIVNSASLYKTLASYRVLQLVDDGALSLDTMTTEDVSIEQCVHLAISTSDNPCGAALQKLANPYQFDKLLPELGMKNTTLSGYFPQTTARDQLKLYSDIYAGEGLSADSHMLLLKALSEQKITNRLPAFGPRTNTYHKTGDLAGVVHSATVVEMATQSYVVIIMSDNWDLNHLSKYSAIKDIHSQIHETITKYE